MLYPWALPWACRAAFAAAWSGYSASSSGGLRGASIRAGDGDSDSMIELMEKSKYHDDEDEDEAKDEDGNIKNLLCLFISYVQCSLL
jgi:hypothetical protein